LILPQQHIYVVSRIIKKINRFSTFDDLVLEVLQEIRSVYKNYSIVYAEILEETQLHFMQILQNGKYSNVIGLSIDISRSKKYINDLRKGKEFSSRDIAKNAENSDFRNTLLDREVESILHIPVLNENDIKGVIGSHGASNQSWSKDEINTLNEVSSINNSLDLTEFLLEEAKVAVVPGIEFGADNYIRISFAVSTEEIKEGITRINKSLSILN